MAAAFVQIAQVTTEACSPSPMIAAVRWRGVKMCRSDIEKLERSKNVSKLSDVIRDDPFSELASAASEALERIDGSGRVLLLDARREHILETVPATGDAFPVHGAMTAREIADVSACIQTSPGVDGRIMDMVVLGPDHVSARTGAIRGPLVGSGSVVFLERRNSGWQLECKLDWIT